MTDKKHTEILPFIIGETRKGKDIETNDEYIEDIVIRGLYNNPIALIISGSGSLFTDEEVRTNTEFIIRACNNHYQLIEILKAFVGRTVNSPDNVFIINKANTIIANAEKEDK